MKLGKSQREKEPTKVASIAAFNPDGLLLFGLRNDVQKWTLPGGHFEPGEEPIEAARRELEEETGLKGENFEFLGAGEVRGDLHIYCFRCLVVGEPDGGDDPDEECSKWKWTEAHDIPEEIMGNLHSKKNITLRLLGIQEGEVEDPLEKKDLLMTKPLPVQHYSTTPGLKTLDPSFQGTGAAGQERNRSKRIPRTYYYTRPGTPEAHVASAAHLYHAELPVGTRLYDMGDDKLNLKAGKWKQTKHGMFYEASDLDQVEKKLKKLGYHGYHSYGVKDALAYFHPLAARHIVGQDLHKGFLATAALAGAMAMGGASKPPAAPHVPEQHQTVAKPQMSEIAQQTMPAWTPEELHPDLIPIAHLESSFGQNMAHASNKKGEFHTAFGALGFKPVTAHEEYTKSKLMNQKYPGLSAPETFLEKFKNDPKFYNLLASAHFARLKHRHGDPQKAAYAWRWGTGACANATDEQIKNDHYVQQYTAMTLHGKQLQKSESGEWWHGSPSGELKGGTTGLHVGTKEAAHQALTARIGYPVEGSWDGTREYGKTMLAGQKTLRARGIFATGYSSQAPEEDHYPTGSAQFSDGTPVLSHHKPHLFKVAIVGPMSNTPQRPHGDTRANALMAGQVKRGTAKRGYYYQNEGEDTGSISAVVPNGGTHLEIKKTEHDPLEAMLQHENPRERILALKNKHVTPYHLRMALQDEDPEVRAFAARHPKMTAPMIHEALHHEDIYTRKAALSRPDLTPEHIQSVLFDPDLQTLAALHPRCTEEQRSMVTDHHLTPPGLKHELLAKTVGYLMYPRLGQNKVPSTPMIRSPEAHQEMAVVGADKPDLHTAMSHGYTRYNMKRNTPVAPERRNFSMSVKTGPGMMATLGHETQHGIFAHLKQQYGKEAGHRIVATTLAALDPKEHAHLKNLTDWSLKGYDTLRHPEERIAYLQNYLQDSMWRAKAHKAMRILGHRNAEKASHDIAKQIWQKLRIKATNLTPQEVGVILKTEADRLTEWADLRKGDVQVEQIVKADTELEYNTYEDQLGMQPKFEAFLKAAKFLAHTEPDYGLFRQALLSGLEVDAAALTSVGLPTDSKNKRAILAVVSLQDGKLIKSAHKTHEVQALMPDGSEVADGVRRGFAAETDQDLHLGGKHSKGTLMVRDPETGMMYLLKPGSGKQSPASGAREEGANQSRREAAFWHVADAMGLGNRVPRADLLLIDGHEVAALHLLPFSWKNLEKLKFEDVGLPHKALEKYRHTGELHKWAVMDYVLGNPDRHGQNLMVGPEKDGFPVALIDHGSAFAGPSFDPARDKNSFIPYYLRAWKGDAWHDLQPSQRLRAMPSLNEDSDEQLRKWLEGIHGGDLEQVLARYGIDPQPSLERLAKIRRLLTEPSVSQAINQLWLET